MAQAKDTGFQHFYMMELAPGLIIDARNKCVHACCPYWHSACLTGKHPACLCASVS